MTPNPRPLEKKRRSATILVVLLVALAIIAGIFIFFDTAGEDSVEANTTAVPMEKEGVIEDRDDSLDPEPGGPPLQALHDENNPSPTAPPTQPDLSRAGALRYSRCASSPCFSSRQASS